jgi:hypothetical protein
MTASVCCKPDELLCSLRLRNGWSHWKHQPHLIRCTVRTIYYLYHGHVLLYRQYRPVGAIGTGICQFVVGGLMGKYGVGNPPNVNVIIQVEGASAHTIIAFCYIIS